MVTKSLRLELMAWLLLPMGGLVLVNSWLTHASARETARLITDHTLLASARSIAEQVRTQDGVLEATIPPSALEMFASEDHDWVVYRILDPKGGLLAGSSELELPPVPPGDLEPVYFDGRFRAEKVRAVAMAQPVILSAGSQLVLVVLGETLRGRDRMEASLWTSAFWQQAVLLALAASLIWFGLDRGLAPLLRLRDAVLGRRPDDLEPFPANSVQGEIRPLVLALNDFMHRLEQKIARERRFLANAAHQLRTPLAVLKTQTGYGLREPDPAGKDETLRAVDAGIDALSRLTNQLLVLARTEPDDASAIVGPVDLVALTSAVLGEMAPRALDRGLDLGFEALIPEASVASNATLLQELVANLVDNAIRCSRPGDTITVSIARERVGILLAVEDTGPGLPDSEKERVFERFYRAPGSAGDGSGLGLAIVREIASLSGGTVRLANRSSGSGLRAEVYLLPSTPVA
jgi:two-component system sensor histidine kinase TctE